jgi:hypothetical protein
MGGRLWGIGRRCCGGSGRRVNSLCFYKAFAARPTSHSLRKECNFFLGARDSYIVKSSGSSGIRVITIFDGCVSRVSRRVFIAGSQQDQSF